MNSLAPFTQRQVDYLHRARSSWFNVAEGGKRGGKNVINALAWCIELDTHADRFHLAAGVDQSSARINILECDGYGVKNYFEDRCRIGKFEDKPCLYIQSKVGGKVVFFAGGGKAGSEANIKGYTYGTVYITEANECHPDFVQEAFDRTISSSCRKIFHDLNPKAPGHRYYTEILAWHDEQQKLNADYGYNWEKFTLLDNLSISDEKLREVLKTYKKGTMHYDRDILGNRKQAEGLVYPMFSDVLHVVPEDKMPHNRHQRSRAQPYEKYYVSADYGTMNPCVFILWGLRGGVHYAIDEYYYSGRDSTPRTDGEHYAALCELVGKRDITRIIIDPSAASFITLIRKKKAFAVGAADNAVIDGIRECGTALEKGLLKFSSRCENTINEFGLYSWDKKKTEDTVIKEDDHAMDAVRYLVKTLKLARMQGAA